MYCKTDHQVEGLFEPPGKKPLEEEEYSLQGGQRRAVTGRCTSSGDEKKNAEKRPEKKPQYFHVTAPLRFAEKSYENSTLLPIYLSRFGRWPDHVT